MSFGNTLKKIRKEKGLSIRELGRLTGVSSSYISQLERGTRKYPPHFKIINKLMKVFGDSYFELVDAAWSLSYVIDIMSGDEINPIFNFIKSDPRFIYGPNLPRDLDESTKLFIIELYEFATKQKFLSREANQQTSKGSSLGRYFLTGLSVKFVTFLSLITQVLSATLGK